MGRWLAAVAGQAWPLPNSLLGRQQAASAGVMGTCILMNTRRMKHSSVCMAGRVQVRCLRATLSLSCCCDMALVLCQRPSQAECKHASAAYCSYLS